MAEHQRAWERQSDSRQWDKPEGDDPVTLYRMMKTSVERFSDQPLFGYVPAEGMPRSHITYGEFADLVDAVASGMVSRGVVAGDRIALIVDNSVEWAATALAANAVGALYTAMYTQQRGKEWAYILGDSTPSMVVVANTAVLDKLVEAMPDDASAWPANGIVLLGEDEANEVPPEGIEVVNWSAFVQAGRAADALGEVADDPMALATLIYTSGTTGNPKGVMLTNWNILSNILSVQSVFPIYIGDKSASFLPWAHVFGSTVDLFYMIRSGVHVNLISDLTRIADELVEIKPAVMCAVPRVWNRFYDRVNAQLDSSGVKRFLAGKARKHAAKRIAKAGVVCDAVEPTTFWDKRFDSLIWGKVRDRFGGNLRFAISGASALSPDVAKFIQMVGISCFEGYGLSETSPMVSANGWMGYGESRLNSVGKVLNGIEVTIDTSAWDDPDRPDEGEIIVTGPNVMQGYWNKPEETAKVIMEPGTFRTGDLGKLSKDGYLTITGRVKSQFKLENGKYVSPAPLEENLKLDAVIEQAALDGRNRRNTFLIVHPNMEALRKELNTAGIATSDDDAAVCADPAVGEWLLNRVATHAKGDSNWKGYEIPRDIILDHDEWTTDNGLMTPTMKVKLRNLLTRHEDAIAALD
ncbi:MAG: AMP-binding protein [Candidatus Thermoplasmatota archaeon]|nr:AMP-binding protein [Candidatus Thermoplasmatota archaeon]MEC8079604.1 AMP-binding protein [Candidatus Thermoplasmatota archaeon]MEC9204673.1 AMP-binding protein [Candidatus Thermoplasmatota archaeon]